MHLPLPLWVTTLVMDGTLCIFHCHCGRQDVPWKVHGAYSIATAGDSICNKDPLCIFHCHCGDKISNRRCIMHLPSHIEYPTGTGHTSFEYSLRYSYCTHLLPFQCHSNMISNTIFIPIEYHSNTIPVPIQCTSDILPIDCPHHSNTRQMPLQCPSNTFLTPTQCPS